MREATTRSVVGWRWLIVHLTVRTSSRTKALRSAVGFGSFLRTRDLIALDLDGLLRFNQIVTQLLECIILPVDLFIQVTDFLKQ